MEKRDIKQKTIINRDFALRVLKPVSNREKAFYFATNMGQYTEYAAFSLSDFSEKLKTINIQSVEFHCSRKDFEKWIQETIGDPELATQIKEIKELKGEQLRKEILQTVENRINKLANIANLPTKNK